MAKPWLDPDAGAVGVLRMMLREMNGHDRIAPITLKNVKIAKEIAGFKLAPANKDGIRNWVLRPGWEARLAEAGIP